MGSFFITGHRNKINGLWDILLQSPPSPHHTYTRQELNIIVNKTQSKPELDKYLYGCAFSPVISTFKTAIIKGNFVTWPGIDAISFDKLAGPAIVTAKCHLDQERQGLQSTKPKTKLEEAYDDAFPSQSLPKTRDYGIIITSVKIRLTVI